MYIPIILGTARSGRRSEWAAKFMAEAVEKAGLETEILDVREYHVPATDDTEHSPQAKKFSEKILRADGLIIVSPEYNHSYPGELKMMLDMLYEEYHRKPVGICGVSIGQLGGGRMVEQLRLVAIEFHMVPIREAIYFGFAQKLFDDKGRITDPTYYDRAKKFLDELIWYAKALKEARDAK